MNEALDSYLSRANESLDAAEMLLAEGYAGFAVSRAYYAMFYLAEGFLSTREITRSSHSGVIATFGQSFVKSGIVPANFHRYLIRAQEVRLLVDYRGTPLTDDEAQEQIARAREFLTLAHEYFHRQPPATA